MSNTAALTARVAFLRNAIGFSPLKLSTGCEHVTIASETSNPPLYNNSVVCERSLHRNSTNMNTHEIT
ncbi:uncharacterized protein DAT39_020086, partial [Clarias magur]